VKIVDAAREVRAGGLSPIELAEAALHQAAQASHLRVTGNRDCRARDSPHPGWLRCRQSTHKNQCASLLRLAIRARMSRSLIRPPNCRSLLIR